MPMSHDDFRNLKQYERDTPDHPYLIVPEGWIAAVVRVPGVASDPWHPFDGYYSVLVGPGHECESEVLGHIISEMTRFMGPGRLERDEQRKDCSLTWVPDTEDPHHPEDWMGAIENQD